MSFNLEELGFKEGQTLYYVTEAKVYHDRGNGTLEPDWQQYSEEWLTEEQWRLAKNAQELHRVLKLAMVVISQHYPENEHCCEHKIKAIKDALEKVKARG